MRTSLPFLAIIAMLCNACNATATPKETVNIEPIAAFFDVPPTDVHMECPQQTYSIHEEDGHDVLTFCLSRSDQRKRCEVAISPLNSDDIKAHATYSISMDMQRTGPSAPHEHWHSLFQIHNKPDVKESWRCPVAALEVDGIALRMFNRWDSLPMSRTSGNHCTEAGSSITSRTLFDQIPLPLNQWHRLAITTRFAHNSAATPPGLMRVSINDTTIADVTGPNRFNDFHPPYLKFGIYKPTAWNTADEKICVRYRNVEITHQRP